MENFLLTKSAHLKIKSSQLENCTLNCNVCGNHQMRQRYYICKCCPKCPLTFKTNTCVENHKHIAIFHEKSKNIDCVSKVGIIRTDSRPTRGVAPIVKKLIEKMCTDDADNPPKRILTTIIKQIKDNKIFDKALIPSLRQVCICIYI